MGRVLLKGVSLKKLKYFFKRKVESIFIIFYIVVLLMDKKILDRGVVNFFYKKEEYRSLSNFWECDVVVGGREYESGEHCFHGEKYRRVGEVCGEENRKRELLEYSDRFVKGMCVYKKGADVKKLGGKKGMRLSEEELRLWGELSLDVQKEISRYKWVMYEEVKNDLKKSVGKVLVHPALRCSEEKLKDRLWEGKGVVREGKVEVVGKNMLGNIWMALREEVC